MKGGEARPRGEGRRGRKHEGEGQGRDEARYEGGMKGNFVAKKRNETEARE